MFLAYPKTPEEDGRHFFFQFETVKALIRGRELPLWNPFDCHGIPLWSHPESMAGGPILLLTTGLSTTITVMLWNIIHVVVGFVGMWLLGRDDLKLTRTATFITASMWAFGVAHADQYAGEHSTLAGFLYAPLLLFLWRKGEESWDARVGLGLMIALMVFEGQTYPLPYTLLVVGLETTTRIWRPRRARKILVAGVTVALVGIMVSACRLLPLVDELRAHKRPMEPDFDHLMHLKSIIDMYVLRTPHWRSRFADQQYVFGEYLTYIGWLGVGLVVLGVAVSVAENTWLVVLAAMTFVLMLGHFAPWAPYHVLQEHVLPFKSMRVPSRYRFLMLVHVSLFVGLAVDRVPKLWRQIFGMPKIANAMHVALAGIAFIVVGDGIGLAQEIMAYRFNGAPEQRVARAARFHYATTGLTPDFIDQPRQNEAWLGCRHYTWAFGADAPVWTGDVPQARALDDGAVVEVGNRTHNTFTVDVDVKRPSRIVLNSAWDRGWRSDIGTLVQADNKLIAIDLPPGRYQVHARFWPDYLTLGLWMSGLGIAGVIVFFARRPLIRSMRRRGEAQASS